MNEQFHEALEEADREMSDLLRQRVAIDERINQLKVTRDALAKLLENAPDQKPHSDWHAAVLGALSDPALEELGISNAIRKLLSESRTPLYPTEIKYKLADAGFPLDSYANALAVIHTTLKRLERQGELLSLKDPSGKVFAYTKQWRTG